MTELEKLRNHVFYNCDCEEIRARVEYVKERMYVYNRLRPTDRAGREAILRELFGKVGKDPWIEAPFQCDIGFTMEVGDNFYVNYNCVFLDAGGIIAGNDVRIGPNTGIYTPQHAFDPAERAAGYECSRPVVLGDNVWIGGNVSILGGVTIGENSIIGAGSVVTRSIPADVIAAGNPCRVLRKMTPEDNRAHGPRAENN